MAKSWAELPNDLLVVISKRVKLLEDFIAFRSVCTSWRSAAPKKNFDVFSPQPPLLMLGAKDDDYQEFYSLSRETESRVYLPEARRANCLPAKWGWLWTMEIDTGEMNLLHPFSRTKIQLPSLKDLLAIDGLPEEEEQAPPLFTDRAVLSASPSLTSDYVLVICYLVGGNDLAFWRPGDLNWTSIDFRGDPENRLGAFLDLIYYKGQFYTLTNFGQFWVFDVPGPSTTQLQPHLLFWVEDRIFNLPSVQFYLVEVSGKLLLAARFAHKKYSYETFEFKVFELDLIKGEMKQPTKNLGDSAIFLGRNGAICIDSSKFTGVKPNHIYFTDDYLYISRKEEGGAGRDMGAYNLEDGKIHYFYLERSISLISPPTWVTPSL